LTFVPVKRYNFRRSGLVSQYPHLLSANGESVEKQASTSTVSAGRVPLCRPYLSEEEEFAAIETLRSGWLMQGPKVAEFERLVSEKVGVKHAVALNSGTSALTLSLMAAGLEPGDKIITPSYSFVATANSTAHLGGEPVFVDIGPDDYNIDPSGIEPAIDERTRAIVVVHQFGFPADMGPIMAVAKKHGLLVIEDAACSLGSTYGGKQTGSFGKIACLSFHPRKIITTGEGGMALTDSDEIADRIRSLRNHGLSSSPKGASCHEAGYNFRLTDLQAAIGIVQLGKLEEIMRLRTRLAERYTEAISELPALRLPKWPEGAVPNFQSFAVELADQSVDREALLSFLDARGVGGGPGIYPIHMQPTYAEKHACKRLPETLRAAERSFFLPLYPGMADEEAEFVIGRLKESLAEQSAL
jgi:perosamine synthetase